MRFLTACTLGTLASACCEPPDYEKGGDCYYEETTYEDAEACEDAELAGSWADCYDPAGDLAPYNFSDHATDAELGDAASEN